MFYYCRKRFYLYLFSFYNVINLPLNCGLFLPLNDLFLLTKYDVNQTWKRIKNYKQSNHNQSTLPTKPVPRKMNFRKGFQSKSNHQSDKPDRLLSGKHRSHPGSLRVEGNVPEYGNKIKNYKHNMYKLLLCLTIL